MRERRLPPRDRAFATELTYGALRAQGSLDLSLDRFIKRSVDPPVRDALRLGAYQLWRTRVPARAAVSTTVDLVRTVSPRAAGFANAVMRRVSEDPEPPAPSFATDPRGHLAVVHSHPALDRRRFRRRARRPERRRARRRAWPPTTPVRSSISWPAAMTATNCSLPPATAREPGRWSPRAVYLPGGDPGELAAVRDGRAAVQDEGSQLVALALAGADAPGTAHDRSRRRSRGKGGVAGGARDGRRRTRAARDPCPTGRAHRGVAVAVGDGRWPPFRAGVGGSACCSMPPAPGSEPCAVAPKPAGGAPPPTSNRWPRFRRSCCAAPSAGPSGRRDRLRDLLAAPARDDRGASAACWPARRRVEQLDARAAAARRHADAGTRAERAALAAPARHRRHVHRPAAPRRLASPFVPPSDHPRRRSPAGSSSIRACSPPTRCSSGRR